MKTPRFNISIVTAVAVGTLILICSADAQPGKMFARNGRHAEDSSPAREPGLRVEGKAKQLPNQNRLRQARPGPSGSQLSEIQTHRSRDPRRAKRRRLGWLGAAE